MSYYNTTSEKGQELKSSHSKARTQEEKIYSFFLTYGQPLSPSMVLDKLNLDCPITSVRRAMTNLTENKKITKTDEYVKKLDFVIKKKLKMYNLLGYKLSTFK